MNKDLRPRNDKNQPHGYWVVYYANGKIWYNCVYVNGKENGFEECYSFGKITEKRYYL